MCVCMYVVITCAHTRRPLQTRHNVPRYASHPLHVSMYSCVCMWRVALTHTHTHSVNTYIIHSYIHADRSNNSFHDQHAWTHACIHTYTYIHIHTYMHTYIHTYIHTTGAIICSASFDGYMHAYTHNYIRTSPHTHTHTPHTYIYIHTYIHTKCVVTLSAS